MVQCLKNCPFLSRSSHYQAGMWGEGIASDSGAYREHVYTRTAPFVRSPFGRKQIFMSIRI